MRLYILNMLTANW